MPSHFNPRSRVGNDFTVYKKLYEYRISIHVPAWGTTAIDMIGSDKLEISIHVPAWGTTGTSTYACADTLKFQSTFPRGERPDAPDRSVSATKFQSTFPRGERPIGQIQDNNAVLISIHVPAWGTTDQEERQSLTKTFQSTFPRGERHTGRQ